MLRRALSRMLSWMRPQDSPVILARERWRAGERHAAIALLRNRCASRGADAAAHGLLGAFLIEQARHAHALAAARRGAPEQPPATLYREAVEHLARASVLAPAEAATLRNRGIALRELGELSLAHEAFAQAHRVAPQDPDIMADLAFSLQCAGDTQAAVALYERAIGSHPQGANAHAGLALSLLGAGDYARGWDEYEWRLRVPGSGIRREFPFPNWQGEDLAGRCLLVYSEQGIGDEIMFASCFDELSDMAARCVFESSVRLAPLFARSFPRATILRRDRSRMPDWAKLPKIDVHIAAGSVPRYLRGAAERFPARERYLSADPARASHWRDRLREAGPGRKIGIAWSGGLPGTLRAARSLPLEALRSLLATPGATFVAREFLDCSAEVSAFNSVETARVHWWPEAVKTIDETAALVSCLDLVISVTTATAHLAGALGRPTWVLVPSVPTWRYMWQGERMPWYPSMRILRTQGDREPRALIGRTQEALAAWLRAG